ncbi:VIT1/CCC1 transporter family protein [Candidatus Woesebacteria bacterium]|nr:VIT1/CCC1 transporter family protein [Candidatus Woesebacteria bacterium]
MANQFTKRDLKEHLSAEHNVSPLSEYLQELVLGGVDGIVTTFAVVAGFTGAQSSEHVAGMSYLTVLLFGLANLFGDAASMGLGNFLSIRAEQDRYAKERDHEVHEIHHNPELEVKESMLLLQEKGFTKQQATKLVNVYKDNPEFWADFMMQYELEINDPRGMSPLFIGLATFGSFMIFGFVPLLPYILLKDQPNAFIFALTATASALFVLGVIRWRITKINAKRSILETLILGTIAASIAYIVGVFFRG